MERSRSIVLEVSALVTKVNACSSYQVIPGSFVAEYSAKVTLSAANLALVLTFL